MSSCVIKTCKNHYKKLKVKSGGITFHIFPKDPKIKEKWVEAVRREGWSPGPRTTICSDHFEESCFDLNKKRRYLLPNSIPTLKLDTDQSIDEKELKVERPTTNVLGAIIDKLLIKKMKSRITYLEYLSHQRLLKIKRLQGCQRRLKLKIDRLRNSNQELKNKLLSSIDTV